MTLRGGSSRALVVLLGLLLAVSVIAALDGEPTGGAGQDRSQPPSERSRAGERESAGAAERPRQSAEPGRTREPDGPTPTRRRAVMVSRVVDGDTVELADGRTVRLVGIDTPEVGECGYERAGRALERLVLGRTVRLAASDEDRDQYGRLLRYVDVRRGGRTVDAGYTLIRRGLAIARYDSRDGYGRHPREGRYVAADELSPGAGCSSGARGLVGQQPQPRPQRPGSGCASGYDPCVPPYPPDVDCPDVDGPVRVTGRDPHGLDADGDGWACES